MVGLEGLDPPQQVGERHRLIDAVFGDRHHDTARVIR